MSGLRCLEDFGGVLCGRPATFLVGVSLGAYPACADHARAWVQSERLTLTRELAAGIRVGIGLAHQLDGEELLLVEPIPARHRGIKKRRCLEVPARRTRHDRTT